MAGIHSIKCLLLWLVHFFWFGGSFACDDNPWEFHVLRLSYVFHSDDWCRLLSDNNLVITSLLHTQASTPSLWFFTTHFALLSDIINLSLTCPVFVNLFPICAKCNLHREGICVCVLLLLYFHCLKRNVWHLADLQKYLLNEWIYKGTD